MKRLLSCYASDLQNLSKDELKQAISTSEGRTILGETVVTAAPLLEGVSNPEVMASFGADLIVLNEFDVFTTFINGFHPCENPIAEVKRLTGRPVGINLEPVDSTAQVLDEKVILSKGRQVSKESLQAAQNLGVDFLMLTGNPSTGVSLAAIKEAIALSKTYFKGLIFAGKMHGAGLSEDIFSLQTLTDFIKVGADGVLIPSPSTVPFATEEAAYQASKAVKELGGLVITTIGTSQESADEMTIRTIGLSNKRIGADIHHIGDGGYGRMPIPENILALGLAIRGRRHTYFKMSQSPLR
ncbi:haloacid dehalogenase-like hydrolase [Streptococcus pneumoniae]